MTVSMLEAISSSDSFESLDTFLVKYLDLDLLLDGFWLNNKAFFQEDVLLSLTNF